MSTLPSLPKFTEYGLRYCGGKRTPFGWDYRGATNTTELQLFLQATCLLRRTKADVFLQLPPKIRQQIFVRVRQESLRVFAKQQSLIPQSILTKNLPNNFSSLPIFFSFHEILFLLPNLFWKEGERAGMNWDHWQLTPSTWSCGGRQPGSNYPPCSPMSKIY